VDKGIEGAKCFDCELTHARSCVECHCEAGENSGVEWGCQVEVILYIDTGVHSVWFAWCTFGLGGGGARDEAALRRASASLSWRDQLSPWMVCQAWIPLT